MHLRCYQNIAHDIACLSLRMYILGVPMALPKYIILRSHPTETCCTCIFFRCIYDAIKKIHLHDLSLDPCVFVCICDAIQIQTPLTSDKHATIKIPTLRVWNFCVCHTCLSYLCVHDVSPLRDSTHGTCDTHNQEYVHSAIEYVRLRLSSR